MNRVLVLTICLLAAGSFFAQGRKRHFRQSEIGFFGGGAYYIGDLNTRNHFMPTHPAAGILYRFSNNYRYAFRGGLNAGTISADDAGSGEADQIERNLNFRSRVFEAHAIAEFNFVEYRIGHDRYRFTMFVFGGLAGFYFDPQLYSSNSFWSMQGRRTEGKSYPLYQVSVPFGVGIKWAVTDKIGFALEWGPRHTFTDYLDDVSGTYPEVEQTDDGFVHSTLAGPARPGDMRGNPRTRDWYFFYGLSLSIKLREAHRQCHSGG